MSGGQFLAGKHRDIDTILHGAGMSREVMTGGISLIFLLIKITLWPQSYRRTSEALCLLYDTLNIMSWTDLCFQPMTRTTPTQKIV